MFSRSSGVEKTLLAADCCAIAFSLEESIALVLGIRLGLPARSRVEEQRLDSGECEGGWVLLCLCDWNGRSGVADDVELYPCASMFMRRF